MISGYEFTALPDKRTPGRNERRRVEDRQQPQKRRETPPSQTWLRGVTTRGVSRPVSPRAAAAACNSLSSPACTPATAARIARSAPPSPTATGHATTTTKPLRSHTPTRPVVALPNSLAPAHQSRGQPNRPHRTHTPHSHPSCASYLNSPQLPPFPSKSKATAASISPALPHTQLLHLHREQTARATTTRYSYTSISPLLRRSDGVRERARRRRRQRQQPVRG